MPSHGRCREGEREREPDPLDRWEHLRDPDERESPYNLRELVVPTPYIRKGFESK